MPAVIPTREATVLRPMHEDDADALFAACRDERVWRLMPQPIGRDRETFEGWLAAALKARDAEPFVVQRGGTIVGSTRLLTIDMANLTAELGYTWYRPDCWGTEVNPTAKHLLLSRAFAELGLERVHFYVDARNARSQAAVERLGAVREGVLRSHRVLHDGYRRDTVVFSILRAEWPGVRAGLEARIQGLAR